MMNDYMGDATVDKSLLRESVIAKLTSLTEEEKSTYEKAIMDQLVQSSLWKKAETIGMTVSHGIEWDTTPLIQKAWQQGKQVAVPKCEPSHKQMTFYKLTHFEQLETVYFNLREPKPSETIRIDKNTIDLLIVPGVVFNEEGYRIGFGGGYYDRFLADFKHHTLSLLHPYQLERHLPVEAHDIAVEHLLTPQGFIK